MAEEKLNETSTLQEEVLLPSRGKFYGGLLPSGAVTLRVITVKEEKIMAGAKNRLRAADRVLERCLIDCPVPLKDMLITDKFYLLLYLRSISYGSDYSYQITCANCGMKFQQSVTLVKGLQIKMASDDDVEPFEVALPRVGKPVTLRFLRGSDEDEILRYVEQLGRGKTETADEDPSYEYRLAKHIVTIDGKEVDAVRRMQFVETLTGADSLAIRRAIGQRETGASLGVTARCPACAYTNETYLPITAEFFPAGVS